MGRMPLDMTPDEKVAHTKERKRKWQENNKDAVFSYARKSVLAVAYKRKSIPTFTTCKKYNITREEILSILDTMFPSEDNPIEIGEVV